MARNKNPKVHPEIKGVIQESKYKPEYCQMLVDHMSEGFSFETFAAKINVCRDTLYEWVKQHPEFAKAKKIAFDKCQMWWEQAGKEGMFMGGKDNPFQSAIWNFNMSARFRWSQKSESKVEIATLESLLTEANDEDNNE